MNSKKSLIIRCAIRVVIAIVLFGIIAFAVDICAPHMSNDLAIGQLENDDMSWSIMQTWNKFLQIIEVVEIVIFVWCVSAIGIDIYKHNKKENTEV